MKDMNDITKDDTNVIIGIILNPITTVISGTMTNIVNIALTIVLKNCFKAGPRSLEVTFSLKNSLVPL